MPKTPPKKNEKKSIDKKTFDLESFQNSNNMVTIVKDKPLEWIPLSPAFHEATGIPGIPKGYFTLFRGYSNTGKSTAMYEGIKSCQKLGILPVIIDTENNFNWDFAKTVGVEFESIVDSDGVIVNYKGFFLYFNTTSLKERYGNYDYSNGKTKKEFRSKAVLEDVAHLINDLLDLQQQEKLSVELCFFWDSIGSINCYKSVMSNSANNQWNANALSNAFNDIVNDSIPASRKEGSKYTNTFVGIQKIWLDNENKVVKHKGGEAMFYAARLIIHMGGIMTHGTTRLDATSKGNTYYYATKTKIKVHKNQINGIEYEGEIASTPHGFINPEKKNEYTRDHRDFLLAKLNVDNDAEIEFGESSPDIETLREMYVN